MAAFRFIAEVHESLLAAWIDNYVVKLREVEQSFERLLKAHKTGETACLVAATNATTP